MGSRVQHGDMKWALVAWFALACGFSSSADEVLFRDDFNGKLKEGWSWRRENKAAWRIGDGALEIRVAPGNMWGPANDAKNVLVRDLTEARRPLEISMTVSNRPTEQYEQVDLTWYYDDSHMVKIGFERVDGVNSIVMGREERDRTRTIAIIPIDAQAIDLRLIADDKNIRGSFRPAGSTEWREAGKCDLPVHGAPKLAIQCYQGPAKVEHWARISNVTVRVLN
jgi:regulation of enolase protein 1 (concanavalin A-like superfamily)